MLTVCRDAHKSNLKIIIMNRSTWVKQQRNTYIYSYMRKKKRRRKYVHWIFGTPGDHRWKRHMVKQGTRPGASDQILRQQDRTSNPSIDRQCEKTRSLRGSYTNPMRWATARSRFVRAVLLFFPYIYYIYVLIHFIFRYYYYFEFHSCWTNVIIKGTHRQACIFDILFPIDRMTLFILNGCPFIF